MGNQQFKFGKVFAIWFSILVVALAQFFLSNQRGDGDFGISVLTALITASVIALLVTIIQKWIFEGRNRYGDVVKEKISTSELMKKSNTSVKTIESFVGKFKLVIIALFIVPYNLFWAAILGLNALYDAIFPLEASYGTSREGLGWVSAFLLYNFMIFGTPFYLLALRAWFQHKLTTPNKWTVAITTLSFAAAFFAIQISL